MDNQPSRYASYQIVIPLTWPLNRRSTLVAYRHIVNISTLSTAPRLGLTSERLKSNPATTVHVQASPRSILRDLARDRALQIGVKATLSLQILAVERSSRDGTLVACAVIGDEHLRGSAAAVGLRVEADVVAFGVGQGCEAEGEGDNGGDGVHFGDVCVIDKYG